MYLLMNILGKGQHQHAIFILRKNKHSDLLFAYAFEPIVYFMLCMHSNLDKHSRRIGEKHKVNCWVES